MNSYNDWKQVVRRNKLVGMWAAEKLGWRAFVTRFVDEHPLANFCFPESRWIN